jgi:yersiniabactin nonribosomal peptide synthetase
MRQILETPETDRAEDRLRRTIAEATGLELAAVGPDDDLIQQGLDSISMMGLVARWREQGIEVRFAELAERPTLGAWLELTTQTDPVGATSFPDAPAPAPDMDPFDERAPFELSTLQLAYWVGRAPGQPLGAPAHFYAELEGADVSAERVQAAAARVIARHGMLRVRFLADGRQQIDEEARWPGVVVHDLRSCTETERAAELARLRDTLSHRRLDVERGVTFDLQLSRLDERRTRLHVDIDMLAADAQSFRILLAELATEYTAETGVATEPPGISYPRYLHERRRRAGADEQRDRARAYWRDRVDTLPGPPQLPLRIDPAELADPRTERRHVWLAPDRAAIIAERAKAAGVTPPVAFAAAFASVLAAWSAQPRFVLNLPVYDRVPVHPDVQRLIGDFTNVILLEVDGSPRPSFTALAQALQSQLRADAHHSDYSGVDVLRDLARARPGEPISAPVVFTSAISLGELFGDEVRQAFGEPVWTTSQTPQVWLDCQVTERERGLYLNWDVVEELFAPGVIDAMWSAFVGLVERLADPRAADWDRPAPLIPASQLAVRAAANATATATAGTVPARGLHTEFFTAAEDRRDTPAVIGVDRTLTHGQLRDAALGVARGLIRRGVRPGDGVGVCLPKGPDQIVAVLGALAAGAVYVPIAVDQPVLRRERIAASAGIRVMIDDLASVTDREEEGGPLAVDPGAVDPDAPAYIIYTSGSTGEPKGVEVSHRAALNTIDAIVARWAIGATDRALAVSALDFDLSVFDIFGLLGAGGAIVVPDEDTRREAAAWSQLARENLVTVVNCAPALLQMLIDASGDDALASLRLVLLGGDWVALDLPRRLHALAPACRFVALGGTTETAIHSTVCEVVGGEVPHHWRSIPYGLPLRGQKLRVVGLHGHDCPDWVPGELWIGGESVARGYHGDRERTARQFVTHNGARYYRTGDLARYWPDGNVEFLGREDHQIKLRGHRIELGEIETALETHPGVDRAVAVLVDTGAAPQLAIAYAPSATGEPGADSLRSHLREHLPAHMIPEQLQSFAPLPLTANGKIDRRSIAEQLTRARREWRESAGAPLATPVEHAVAAVWAELLQRDPADPPITRDDGFFTLGGDSLVATRMMTRLTAAGVHGARLRDLFAAPVLRDFCASLQLGAAEPSESAAPRTDLAGRHEPFPPTDVQRAYWLGRRSDFSLGGVGSHWYWEFDGAGVDLTRLEDALNRLVARHEMLRAVFDSDGRQRIQAEVPRVRVSKRDVTAGDQAAAIDELRERLAHRRFDPERWPLFGVEAVRCGDRVRIGFGFDYIVLDALSIMIVFSELGRLYAEPSHELAPLELSFRDYVLGVVADPAARERDETYWRARLDRLPPAPELPLAVDPSGVSGGRFTRRRGRLDTGQWETLVARGRAHDLTPSTLLATAYAQVLAAWSARSELTLNFTLFDRREVHPDVYAILGDFTSLLLVSHDARAGDTWLTAARRLQDNVWEGMAHRDVSAVWVIRELARALRSPDVSMPVVFTSALGVATGGFDLRAPFGELVWGLSQTPQVWLDCQVMEQAGELHYNWDAVEELFPAGLLDAMFVAFEAVLAWLARPGGDWDTALPELLAPEPRAVRARVNGVRAPLPDRGLHDRFFAQAGERGERPAILGAAGSIGHHALSERARRLAGALRRRGVAPGEPVMVTLPKGPDQIAAVLGVLAAGGAYVPVGIDQPPARRARIAAAAGVRLAVLAPDGGLRSPADAASHAPPGVTLVSRDEWDASPPLADPLAGDPDRLAYIIFTSGSTGEPKGVMMTHRAALNTIDAVNDELRIGPEDRVLAVSALDFDLSVFDLFGLLDRGGALIVPEETQRLEPRHWLELMRRHRATVWNSVPALLDMLLVVNAGRPLPAGLRAALVSGDWIGLDLPGRVADAAPGARFLALGGATEAGIWSNWTDVARLDPEWRSIPYGVPLPNQSFRVVDERGHDRPDWVPGELWIGGSSLAAGYRGDSERTSAQFVIANDGERYYRTGDLGRYHPDGRLEFLGRRDQQIKLRGHRIELGEIESALEAHPGVRRAVVTVRDGTARRLVAVVQPLTGTPDVAEMRAFLGARLPAYMVPEELHVLDELPLTANGKIDRRAIDDLARAQPLSADEPPSGPREAEVAALFGEMLGLEAVSRGGNFFALGGDSLLATRALEAIRRRHGVELSLRELFAAPTVQELGRVLAHALGADAEAVEEGVL